MEDFYKDEILYFTSDEFENRITIDGAVLHTSFEELNKRFNSNNFNPVDGKLVRLSDHYAALLEADSSIRHGITSTHLRDGRTNLMKAYPFGTKINGIDAYSLFNEIMKQ
jgi:putative hydrolase of HD superfamily